MASDEEKVVVANFEWLCAYGLEAQALVAKLLPYSMQLHRVLVLGCGNSKMSEELHYETVVSMDRSSAIIVEMRSRKPELEWHCSTFEAFDGLESFDAAFDKSSLDAELAERGDASAIVNCAHRSLKTGQFYVVISLYPAALIEDLVQGPLFDLVGSEDIFSKASCRLATVSVFSKKNALSFHEEAARQRRVLGHYFRNKSPLLTPERLFKHQRDWSDSCGGSLSKIDPATAYRIFFQNTPEAALYDLDAFLDDRTTWHRTKGGSSGRDDWWDFAETLLFLQEVQ